ncbi:hypothetical protein ACJX0J_028264 [Zea mays]
MKCQSYAKYSLLNCLFAVFEYGAEKEWFMWNISKKDVLIIFLDEIGSKEPNMHCGVMDCLPDRLTFFAVHIHDFESQEISPPEVDIEICHFSQWISILDRCWRYTNHISLKDISGKLFLPILVIELQIVVKSY